jgi:ParB family chromosome partitioning protein
MASNHKKQPALGRGLSALLANDDKDLTASGNVGFGGTSLIPIDQIEANPFNPRTNFEEDALKELTASIMEHGIIQPLTVRKTSKDKYQLISGERRFRASQMAGLTEVPAYIRIANDQSMLEMALVENIQRENLNAIEVGISYQRLIEECALTQEQLGKKVSKSRSDIANHLRLLKLPALIQASVRDGVISMGHARALLSIENEGDQLIAFNAIIAQNLSVREVENWKKNPSPAKKVSTGKTQHPLESALHTLIGLPVKIQQNSKGKGKMVLSFNNEQELNLLVGKLKKK